MDEGPGQDLPLLRALARRNTATQVGGTAVAIPEIVDVGGSELLVSK